MNINMVLAISILIAGCSSEQNRSDQDFDAAVSDSAVSLGTDTGPLPDAEFQASLDGIPGQITYVATNGDDTHIYAVSTDGSGRIRLTQESAPWSFHSVSPNRRYIAAVRANETLDDHNDQLNEAGVIWIIDVRTGQSYPITPENCNAGIGGVSWTGDSFVTFSMKCDDGPAKAYLASYADGTRDINNMLLYGDHMFPVRDVTAALYTSRVLYVVDQERCRDDRCVQKPQIWLADTETLQRCQVTDADRDFFGDPANPQLRIGDHHPIFTEQLRGVVFSRNVPNKGGASTGHHDVYRIGLNIMSLDNNDIRCEQPGTEVNLSDELLGDEVEQTLGSAAPGYVNELFPQPKTGDAGDDSTTMIFVARTNDETESRLMSLDLSGTKTALSLAGEWVVYGRWILGDSELTGTR